VQYIQNIGLVLLMIGENVIFDLGELKRRCAKQMNEMGK